MMRKMSLLTQMEFISGVDQSIRNESEIICATAVLQPSVPMCINSTQRRTKEEENKLS